MTFQPRHQNLLTTELARSRFLRSRQTSLGFSGSDSPGMSSIHRPPSAEERLRPMDNQLVVYFTKGMITHEPWSLRNPPVQELKGACFALSGIRKGDVTKSYV